MIYEQIRDKRGTYSMGKLIPNKRGSEAAQGSIVTAIVREGKGTFRVTSKNETTGQTYERQVFTLL